MASILATTCSSVGDWRHFGEISEFSRSNLHLGHFDGAGFVGIGFIDNSSVANSIASEDRIGMVKSK
jgi:hypothetical protein